MTDFYRHIAAELRRLRTSWNGTGLSQEALATALGTTANTVSRWEAAIYKPSAEELQKIAAFFGVPIGTFYPDSQSDGDERLGKLSPILQQLPEPVFEEVVGFAQFQLNRWSSGLSGPFYSAKKRVDRDDPK